MHDLLITGGRVLDPGQGLDATMDIAISNGLITEVASHIDASNASEVIEIRGPHRYVLPGLIDVHAHVAHGATTRGVGMDFCVADEIGVRSGVTTIVDCGSVGVANVGVFPEYIIPRARTRVICYLNVASHAHAMPQIADFTSMEEIDRDVIASCVEANPGLVSGMKLRLVGPYVGAVGEEVIARATAIARDHSVPLMVHIGDRAADEWASRERFDEVTRYLLNRLEPGDILTHLCTSHGGGVQDSSGRPVIEVREARERGVVLDPAIGGGNFAFDVARAQADQQLHPDTISSDLWGAIRNFHSLLECMAKFMVVGYSLADVVEMTTSKAAKAIGMESVIGAIAVGREADITVIDVIDGDYRFTDHTGAAVRAEVGIVPVVTFRAGTMVEPGWGPHPWAWLPANW
jgi:dihydroorotase